MNDPGVAATCTQVRDFMRKNPTQIVRPVPLAQELGVKDIRRMRSALRQLRDAGELVSCSVQVAGERDEEFRLAAGAIGTPFNGPRLQTPAPAPRRPDNSSAIPSRFNSAPVAPPAIAPAPAGSTTTRQERKYDFRQSALLAFVESENRNVCHAEIFAALRKADPTLTPESVYCAIWSMNGSRLVECEKIPSPKSGRPVKSYATPAIAKRIKEGKAEAALKLSTVEEIKTVAPSPGGDEATRPSVPKAAPAGEADDRVGFATGFLADGTVVVRGKRVLEPKAGRAILELVDRIAGTRFAEELLS